MKDNISSLKAYIDQKFQEQQQKFEELKVHIEEKVDEFSQKCLTSLHQLKSRTEGTKEQLFSIEIDMNRFEEKLATVDTEIVNIKATIEINKKREVASRKLRIKTDGKHKKQRRDYLVDQRKMFSERGN